jgi:diadenylate cyclase
MTDAAVVIVSEESGIISLAHNGQLIRGLDQKGLEQMLQTLYMSHQKIAIPVWRRVSQVILKPLRLVR